MNAQLRKEIRLIAPAFAVTALGLIVLASLGDTPRDTRPWTIFALGLGSAALVAPLFAREFQDGTAIWLLSQPADRRHVYRQKHLVLLAALFIAWLVTWSGTIVEWIAHFLTLGRFGGSTDSTMITSLVAALVFPFLALATGCYWGLVTRNALHAVILTLAPPFTLFLGTIAIIQSFHPDSLIRTNEFLALCVMAEVQIVYGLLIAWRGWIRWREAEITAARFFQSQAHITFSNKLLSLLNGRKSHPLTALAMKELGIQGLVIALLGLNLLIIGASLFFTGSNKLGSVAPYLPRTLSFANNCFLFVAPILCGALAFAEERQLKIYPWLTLQPVSARGQWLAKFSVSLLVAVLCGVLAPLSGNFIRSTMGDASGLVDSDLIPKIVQVALCLFVAAFYLSSVVDTTVKAVIATVLALFGSFIILLVISERLPDYIAMPPGGDEWVFNRLAIKFAPALVGALAFSYSNFRRHGVTRRRMFLQFIALASLIIVGAVVGAVWIDSRHP